MGSEVVRTHAARADVDQTRREDGPPEDSRYEFLVLWCQRSYQSGHTVLEQLAEYGCGEHHPEAGRLEQRRTRDDLPRRIIDYGHMSYC